MADREQLNYYKGNRSFDDVVREEFSFSLIFNNIAPSKMSSALQGVGLSRVPDLFLLIQVDDYSNESKRFSVENEFVMKVRILNIIRSLLTRSRWEHMAANLTGTDNMIVFFCIGEEGEYEEEIARISQEICEKVHRFANYTVSICLSDLCRKPAQFAQNYERAKAILQESFFLGKKLQTKIISTAEHADGDRADGEWERCIQSVYISLSRGDRMLFGRILVQLFSGLQRNGQGRSQALLLAAQLIDKMEEYTRSCGVQEGKCTAEKVAKYKEDILRCSYVDDVCVVLLECYETMWELLDRLRGHSAESIFRETVQQYIRDHYREKIYLDEIAASCGYSKYYFCRQFRKCFGVGLSDSVNQYRVEQAKELICEGNQSVEEISREVGFSSANYFEIIFRKHAGISPTAYRKRRRDET